MKKSGAELPSFRLTAIPETRDGTKPTGFVPPSLADVIFIIHLDGRGTAYNAIANTDANFDSGYLSCVDRTQRNPRFPLFKRGGQSAVLGYPGGSYLAGNGGLGVFVGYT